MISRDFKANEFEWYVQDSWRVKPNLTVTIGLRHTLLQTPYEVNGQQVAPTIDLHQWFNNRAIAAAQGQGNQPEFAFAPSGQSRGGKPYWPMNKLNFAPRLAVAYSPDSKTSIRAGMGMYYDHFGEGIIDGFSQFGSFGLTSTQAAPSNIFTPDDAPRYTGRNDIPPLPGGSPQQTVTYPAFPPDDPNTTGFTFNSNGIDGRIKTPYSIAADFSVQRLGGQGMDVRSRLRGPVWPPPSAAARSGRRYRSCGSEVGHGLLHGSHFDVAICAGRTVKTPRATISPCLTWKICFRLRQQVGSAQPRTFTRAPAAPTLVLRVFAGRTGRGREVGAPFRLGIALRPLLPMEVNPPFVPDYRRFPTGILSSRHSFAWSSLGTSSYNAGQFMLRHPMSHGLQVDFSYTYSKSIDLGSDTERTNSQGTTSTTTPVGQGVSTVLSYIANPWNPGLNRAPSDFDLRHVITANWVYELPFGKGKSFAGGAGIGAGCHYRRLAALRFESLDQRVSV